MSVGALEFFSMYDISISEINDSTYPERLLGLFAEEDLLAHVGIVLHGLLEGASKLAIFGLNHLQTLTEYVYFVACTK